MSRTILEQLLKQWKARRELSITQTDDSPAGHQMRFMHKGQRSALDDCIKDLENLLETFG